LYIYDFIGWGGVTAQHVTERLGEIEAPTLHVRINSPGGDVFDGIAIYNALVRFANAGHRVIAHVDALAASAASFIALAADEVHIAESAMVMIHNAWGFSIGDKHEMRRVADLL